MLVPIGAASTRSDQGKAAATVGAGRNTSISSELAEQAQLIIVRRRARLRFFNPAIFGEPAWDMLLHIYVAEAVCERQTTVKLSNRIGAPLSSAIRWIYYLEKEKMIERQPHPVDRRIMFLLLTQKGQCAVEQYLEHSFAVASP